MNTWKMNSASTTNRYWPSERCDGVSAASVSGSLSAATSGVSSWRRRKAQPQISAPTPALRMTTQASDARIFSGAGLLPINGSGGQLLVYVSTVPGRPVDDAQAVQTKKSVSGARLGAVGSAPHTSGNLSVYPHTVGCP